MATIFSCYPSGTIFLRTKAICSKRMRRLISIRVNYMLGKQYISIHNYTRTLSAFPCGRTQYVRRMRSSIASMIQSVLEFRFMHAIPHSRLQLTGDSSYISGNISSPFQCKERFCDSVSFGIFFSSLAWLYTLLYTLSYFTILYILSAQSM